MDPIAAVNKTLQLADEYFSTSTGVRMTAESECDYVTQSHPIQLLTKVGTDHDEHVKIWQDSLTKTIATALSQAYLYQGWL